MTRRDTILVAVFINVGLLAILFVTAVNSGQEDVLLEPASHPIAQVQQSTVAHPAIANVVEVQPSSLAAPVVSQESPQVTLRPISQNMAPSQVQTSTISQPQIITPTVVDMEANPDDFVEITVKRGDVLERIARRNGTTVEEIMTINQLTNTQLRIGQILRIPVLAADVTEARPRPSSNAEAEDEFYVVRSGDSPWLIAIRNNLKLDELLRLNDLDEESARQLRPGIRLRIR